MEEQDTTNPVGDGDTSSDIEVIETGVETEVQETEPQYDDEGNPVVDQAEPEEEEEEVDLDDLKLKLRKSEAAKARQAMMRQADYTRKTQELAEQRKALEAERQAVTQASEQELSARANLTLIDHQIAELSKVDFNAWFDSDPFEAQKASHRLQALKDAKTQVNSYLGHLQQERTLKQQQEDALQREETAKRLEEGTAKITEAIPEWSKPEYRAKVFNDAKQHFGLTNDDLEGINDPRVVIVLNAAIKGMELQSKAKKAATVARSQEIQPATTLRGTTAKAPVRADTNDFAAFEKYADSKLKA